MSSQELLMPQEQTLSKDAKMASAPFPSLKISQYTCVKDSLSDTSQWLALREQ